MATPAPRAPTVLRMYTKVTVKNKYISISHRCCLSNFYLPLWKCAQWSAILCKEKFLLLCILSYDNFFDFRTVTVLMIQKYIYLVKTRMRENDRDARRGEQIS